MVFKRDKKAEKIQQVMIQNDYGKIESLYGTIRNIDLIPAPIDMHNYVMFEEYASYESETFMMDYGIRDDLHFYEMIPKIGILNGQKLNIYTISSLKIKFGHQNSYQKIKLSYFKIDLIDYEMNVCM